MFVKVVFDCDSVAEIEFNLSIGYLSLVSAFKLNQFVMSRTSNGLDFCFLTMLSTALF